MSSSFDSVRREQAAEGTRMAREERDGEARSRIYGNHQGVRLSKKPSAPKGHEAFLKALEVSGTEIEVEKKASGECIVGVVKHSDKYTITLRCVDSAGAVLNRVIFKHDISEFRALAPKPGSTVEGEDPAK